MKEYKHKVTDKIIEAEQWFEVEYDREAKHGFSEAHGPIYHLDVGYFRHPDRDGKSICCFCDKPMNNHGYIEGSSTEFVCPGDMVILDSCGIKSCLQKNQFDMSYELLDCEEIHESEENEWLRAIKIEDISKSEIEHNKYKACFGGLISVESQGEVHSFWDCACTNDCIHYDKGCAYKDMPKKEEEEIEIKSMNNKFIRIADEIMNINSLNYVSRRGGKFIEFKFNSFYFYLDFGSDRKAKLWMYKLTSFLKNDGGIFIINNSDIVN